MRSSQLSRGRVTIGLISLGLVFLAACSGSKPAELTASVQPDIPGVSHELGGSIDRVSFDAETGQTTIEGWHMFTAKTRQQDLKVYADKPVSVASVTRSQRPDVAEAANNEEFLNAGFTLVLQGQPGEPLGALCISMTDKNFGARILGEHTKEQPRCPAFG